MSLTSKGCGWWLFAFLATSCATPLNGLLAGGGYVDPSGE